jgi:hypothetical protein
MALRRWSFLVNFMFKLEENESNVFKANINIILLIINAGRPSAISINW